MRFKDVFSIIGPDMVGPSSSHTAGAVRIGRVARQLFEVQPEKVNIYLYRSFADTYQGHGTDVALAAGLLNWDTAHEHIPEALAIAEQRGMQLSFIAKSGGAPHPNTAILQMMKLNLSMRVTGTSIGGGNIEIVGVDDFDVRFSASFPTMVITHADRIGMLAEVTHLFSQNHLNIGAMDVDRKSRNGQALTVIEADGAISQELIQAVRNLEGVVRVRMIDLTTGGEEA
ncbi:L-serine ammonia-lyase, iron-sulfur-dependent subunit beta [Paenibacillus radicis (ex Xue et al. 2023)]|uniref:L-serine deaminase n=1 Tax=Paenibacillus radicis (ex Xue et al. 2023) TaxID=2972489 RepID=A0ABT1YS78_9BACL|nr:L-serine ammonia-lyase, iron-sulfur-dependent subunit beta [Paenibacillus radicis (ex Xue et al. 2023)]MCR8635219.1 L-serine ammonia-lyase, iron-sulfur-dependent subunit beta [Paenibacillus radicis (ex Xue et al. 2023)]